MLRRLTLDEQPQAFAFTPANRAWAEAQIRKYPEGRQASAVIPLLWRAQEQEGWLSKPAIEHVAAMLDMAYIRALEVATFYFMFQLHPVGSVAHIQVCGTTPCMLCGAEDLVAVCREKIAEAPHELSPDGKLSWEEVECLGACANAPMVQIGKDFYEDLDRDSFAALLDAFAQGEVPEPGSRKGRFASEPLGGPTALTAWACTQPRNASRALAHAKKDTVARILALAIARPDAPAPSGFARSDAHKAAPGPEAKSALWGASVARAVHQGSSAEAIQRPAALAGPRHGRPDDLQQIKGIGPKLEALCHSLGIFHIFQIADWSAGQTAWMDANLPGFRGRATRDDWVAQAKTLVKKR